MCGKVKWTRSFCAETHAIANKRRQVATCLEVVMNLQLQLFLAGGDCSVKDLRCAGGIGLGMEVSQEALDNAVGGVWL